MSLLDIIHQFLYVIKMIKKTSEDAKKKKEETILRWQKLFLKLKNICLGQLWEEHLGDGMAIDFFDCNSDEFHRLYVVQEKKKKKSSENEKKKKLQHFCLQLGKED